MNKLTKPKRLTDTQLKKIFKKKSIILDIFQCYPPPVTAVRNLGGNIGMTGLNFYYDTS